MIGYIILSIFCLTLSYVVFNLMRKVERLETWIEGYVDRINETQSTLKEIDDKGTFEADDEIGVVFTAIKEAVEELNEITEQEI
jgi:hypothetical protein